MKLLIIFNPHAGHKRAEKLLPELKKELEFERLDYEIMTTEYMGHGTELTKSVDFAMYDGIVAAGGDGVLFEVVNGYFANDSFQRIPLGVIPIGTGNAFARDLNLNVSRWKTSIQIIANRKTKKVDVGKFNTEGRDYYYLNIVGLGFVADVNETAQKFKLVGNLSYTLGVLWQTMFLKSCNLKIEIDGKKIERASTFVEISNTRYTADFLMAPNAKIDDGLLDVTLVNKLSRKKLLMSFPKIFKGEHILLKEVETFQAKQIKIECDETKVLTPDGEMIGTTPVAIDCLPNAIEVFWN